MEPFSNKTMGRKKFESRYLAIQIWSLNTAKAISNDFSILNGSIYLGRFHTVQLSA